MGDDFGVKAKSQFAYFPKNVTNVHLERFFIFNYPEGVFKR